MNSIPQDDLSSIARRFWSKVDRSTTPDGCWLWTGATNRRGGYGRLSVKVDGAWTLVYTHRLSYELAYGSMPAGIDVLHRCDQPRCVNPDHLFVGTARDNALDMFAKGRGRPGHVFGVTSGQAKATEQDVVEIRTAYKEGVLLKVLAVQYGLALSVVHAIATGRTWKHLEGASPPLRRHVGGDRKLTWEQVRAIRARDPREPAAALALEYHVSSATIRLIRRQAIWKEVVNSADGSETPEGHQRAGFHEPPDRA